jgi:hypothetical protein
MQSELPSSTKIVSAGPSSCSISIPMRRNRIGKTADSLKIGTTMVANAWRIVRHGDFRSRVLTSWVRA